MKLTKKLVGFRFVDLFCGIGGFHLALKSFGAKCVFASEIDKSACEVYQNNFHITPEGDIKSIPVENIPAHEILCAGFPCQPFSISGKKKGFDEEGIGDLFDVVKIAQARKPEIILLENVRNFEKHDNGNTLLKACDALYDAGYKPFPKVLCASDYKVPQLRKRIYIVAFKKDLEITNFNFPLPQKDFLVLKDILYNDNDNDIEGNYIIDREYIITKPEDEKRVNKIKRVGQIGKGRQGERIYSIYGQAITLSAQGGGLGGQTGMYKVGDVVRKLYPRECARLMGFPESFILPNTQRKSYKLFGNSVVVDVLQCIILNIIETLETHNRLI